VSGGVLSSARDDEVGGPNARLREQLHESSRERREIARRRAEEE